jgi:hypothetical protein
MNTETIAATLALLALLGAGGCAGDRLPSPESEACRDPASARVGCHEVRRWGCQGFWLPAPPPAEETTASRSPGRASKHEEEHPVTALGAVHPEVEPRPPPHRPEPPSGHPPHK